MDIETTISPMRARSAFLIFDVAGQRYAVPLRDVDQIVAMAELHCPPGTPKLLNGFLNLAGELIPVVCLRYLFDQPDAPPDLWSPLVILHGRSRRLALLVDNVWQVLKVNDSAVLPLSPDHVLNNCVDGIVRSENESVLLLSPDRLLLEQEARSVAELQQLALQRLNDLEVVTA